MRVPQGPSAQSPGARGAGDQVTRGPEDQRARGPSDQRTRGPEEQGATGPKDQDIKNAIQRTALPWKLDIRDYFIATLAGT